MTTLRVRKKQTSKPIKIENDLYLVLREMHQGLDDTFSKVIWRLVHQNAEKKYRKKVPAEYTKHL